MCSFCDALKRGDYLRLALGGPRMPRIKDLRAAGLSPEQIVRVLEEEENRTLPKIREQTRLRTQRYRERLRVTRHCDGGDASPASQAPLTKSLFLDSEESLLDSENRGESYTRPRKNAGFLRELPSDWILPPEGREYARAKGWTEQRITDQEERFRNYWHGSGGKKKDWLATWRNWVTSDYNNGKETNHVGPTKKTCASVIGDLLDKLGDTESGARGVHPETGSLASGVLPPRRGG